MNALTESTDPGAQANPAGPHWYAIHTRARHEKRIDLGLQQAGIETFLPIIHEVHRWSDRRKEVTLPLFPCYLFVRILPDPAIRLTVLKSPGVLNFVGKWDQLPAVPDKEIEQVRAVVQQRDRFFPCPFLKTGQRIRIRGGVLDGVEGILSSHKGASAVVVSVELIQRSVSVLIEGYDVEAA
ncbi:MAG TPA: UpxY family transcription antiterminator [Terriglobales bacterium]|jgi:transcription antitermination factor NusG|nr:UpxY family transcription antiterminator [Terriglobales bacterium]